MKNGTRTNSFEFTTKEASPDNIVHHLLSIEETEWNTVDALFLAFPRRTKLKKNHTGLEHSFIKIENQIVALANSKKEGILGTGNFGLAKLGEIREGTNYAIKIEGENSRDPNNRELKAMRALDFYHGEGVRHFKQYKQFLKRQVKHKRYTLLTYVEGKELAQIIKNDGLNYTQKLITSIQCCLAVKVFHDKHVLHLDIKPENFVANVADQDIKVKLIDFGFSRVLPDNQNSVILNLIFGTSPYIAPEIMRENEYSIAADIYALGMTLQKLKLPRNLYANMINQNKNNRGTIDETIQRLIEALKSQPNLEESALQLIQQCDEEIVENSIRESVNNSPIF